MQRRQVLAFLSTGLAGVLAGCSKVGATLTMDPVDDAGLAAYYARDAERFQDERYNIVANAVENGSTVTETTGQPLEFHQLIGYQGGYYELTHEYLGETTLTEFEIVIDYDPGSKTPEDGEIAFEELPKDDRVALTEAIPAPGEGPDRHQYGVIIRPIYANTSFEQSVLVPDQEYDIVVNDGYRYGVSLRDQKPIVIRTFQYTATQIAADTSELAAGLRTQFLFELTGLSEPQQKIVDAARTHTFEEFEPSESFQDLIDHFHDHEAIELYGGGGDWLVHYEGTEYWATIWAPANWHERTPARKTPDRY